MKKKLTRAKSSAPSLDIKTFTYFIPAPPRRKTGYREKEFDKVLYELLKLGHKLISMTTQTAGGPDGGVLVICVLQATHKNAIGPCLDHVANYGLDDETRETEIELLDD